jgi:hypothetical protein
LFGGIVALLKRLALLVRLLRWPLEA